MVWITFGTAMSARTAKICRPTTISAMLKPLWPMRAIGCLRRHEVYAALPDITASLILVAVVNHDLRPVDPPRDQRITVLVPQVFDVPAHFRVVLLRITGAVGAPGGAGAG